MRLAQILATVMLLALLSRPALAEPRWLACKFNDAGGKVQNFVMVFDDMRGTAALFDGYSLVDGASTTITFQALRTASRSSTSPTTGTTGRLRSRRSAWAASCTGECRRSSPPPRRSGSAAVKGEGLVQ